MMGKAVLTAALALVLAAPSAEAQFGLDSDSAFLAWAADNDFAKYFVGEMRWGRNFQPARDWELGIVRPDNSATLDQAQLIWGDPARSFSFGWDGTNAALDVDGTSVGANVASFVTAPVNTILIRARATAARGASAFLDFSVRLLTGEILFASALHGDDNAEYLVFEDTRLASGFTVVGNIDLDDTDAASNSGSDPAVQIKVGTSVTPEPGTLLLMATGLLGLFGLARRRDRVAA